MRKRIFFLIIISILIYGFTPGQVKDSEYDEICTRGLEGYKTFRDRYDGNVKKNFWRFFDDLVRNLNNEKEFGKILACTEFWNELKYDDLFNWDEGARDDKKTIEEIFIDSIKNYKIYFEERMTLLQAIILKGENSLEKIKKYTGDAKFTQKVNQYAEDYQNIQALVPPENITEATRIKNLLAAIDRNHAIKNEVKTAVTGYADKWAAYYRIGDGNSYTQKEAASRSRFNTLYAILVSANGIEAIDIDQKIDVISTMMSRAQNDENKWRIHKEVNAVVSNFLNMANPTLNNLYETIEDYHSTNASNISLEEPLYNSVIMFTDIPGRRELTLGRLENYLSPRRNGTDNIVKVLKKEFQSKLILELKSQMNAGGRSLAEVKRVKTIANTYREFFGDNLTWGPCISSLEQYYQAKTDNDYPKLLELYTGESSIAISCANVLSRWQLMESKEEVKEKFLEYYQTWVNKVLGDRGNKSKDGFMAFMGLRNQVERYLGSDYLTGDWKTRYDNLKRYFEPKDEKDKNAAAKNINYYFLHLAQSYNIPDPDVAFIKRPDTGINEGGDSGAGSTGTAEADYQKLEEMWTQVKKIKNDRDVVDYILNDAPLRIPGATSAKNALDELANRHQGWQDLKTTYSPKHELMALGMIGQMQTWADNPDQQNKIYNQVIKRMTALKINDFSMPIDYSRMTITSLKKTINNNERYLNLLNGNSQGKNLQAIEKNLNFEILSWSQRIRAHYMFGELFSKSSTTHHVPPCFHYAAAWQMMDMENFSKIILYWDTNELISKSKLEEKICLHCRKVKDAPDARQAFSGQYPKSTFKIDDLPLECLGGGTSPHPAPPGTGAEKTQPKSDLIAKKGPLDILAFLDLISKYLNNPQSLKGNELEYKQIIDIIKNKKLTPAELDDLKTKYISLIPREFDLDLSRFVYYIYKQPTNWQPEVMAIMGKQADLKIQDKLKGLIDDLN